MSVWPSDIMRYVPTITAKNTGTWVNDQCIHPTIVVDVRASGGPATYFPPRGPTVPRGQLDGATWRPLSHKVRIISTGSEIPGASVPSTMDQAHSRCPPAKNSTHSGSLTS